MTPERWKRVEDLFARAGELPVADREAFLAAECGDDSDLFAEVSELLGFGEGAGSFARIVRDEAARRSIDTAFELPERLADRFRIIRRLGAGGMGVVFEAYDERRGEVVALKALPHRDPHRIEALKQEFRILANVSHPHLVRLHELFTDGEHWFFTMQYIRGTELLAHVRPDELDETRLRGVLADVIAGIRAIHRAGRLHRDLKPSNVLVAAGRAVIIDFGLAHDLDSPAEIAGTPDYMAPEVFAGRFSPAGDWYALGVILFEALTGRRPASTSRDPREVVTGLPEDLARLARDLLDRDPAVRLAAIAAGGDDPGDGAIATSFVGRERELAVLERAYREVQDSRAPVLVRVEGISGIGKSTLVSRFLNDLDRAVVLAGNCYERENVPFKALDSVIAALAIHLLDHRIESPEHVGDLCRIFPSLGRVFSGPTTPNPRLARQRAFAALVGVLAQVTRDHPLVIAIDDLQWGDSDSGEMLLGLLAAALPVLWIVAYRSGEPCAVADVLHDHCGPHMVVEPLDADESARLASLLGVGRSAHLQAIVDEAGGNPFFIGQLVRGATALEGGRVELASLVRTRAEALEPIQGRLLATIALAGAPISIEVALDAAELSDDAALPALRAGWWVRTSQVRGLAIVEPYHDRIRAAVVEALDPMVQTTLHGRLARALETTRASPELVALHYRDSGDLERAGRYTIVAAEAAARILAFDRAAELYRDALELLGARLDLEIALGEALANAGRGPAAAEAYLRASRLASGDEIVELERRAAHQYFSTGHVREGQRVGEDVMSRLGLWIPRHPRLAYLIGLARFGVLLARGFRPPRRASDPALAVRRYDVTNELFQSFSTFEPMHGLYFAASAALRGVRLAEPLRRADSIGNVAAIMTLVRGRSGGAAERWLRAQRQVATSVGTPAALGVAATYDGVCATYIGEWASASVHLGEAERLLSSCEGPTYRFQLATVQAIDSWVLFFRGRFAELVRRTSRRLEEAIGKGNLMATNAQTTHAAIAVPLARDDVATATRYLTDARSRLPDTTYSQMHTWLLIARALHSLYVGDPLAGYARLVEELPLLRRSQLLSVHIARAQFLWIASSLCAAVSRVSSGASAARSARQGMSYAKQLERVSIGGALPWGQLCQAAFARGDERRDLLVRARAGFTAQDMLGFAAAAGWHLGGAHREDATRYFVAEGVVRPERFVTMFAGG